MDVAAHIDALRSDGWLMADAAGTAGPDAPVPTCPEWVVRDLVRHMGGAHRWATGYVADARTEVWDVGLDEVVGAWPDDADLLSWFCQGCETLTEALEAAPRDLECWTFLRASSPLSMWARRQAHETAIHRVDAELAAGIASARSPRRSPPTGSASYWSASCPGDRRSYTPRIPPPWPWVARTRTRPGCCRSRPRA
jgi:uncharacterized protein (TIGR03083 family)